MSTRRTSPRKQKSAAPLSNVHNRSSGQIQHPPSPELVPLSSSDLQKLLERKKSRELRVPSYDGRFDDVESEKSHRAHETSATSSKRVNLGSRATTTTTGSEAMESVSGREEEFLSAEESPESVAMQFPLIRQSTPGLRARTANRQEWRNTEALAAYKTAAGIPAHSDERRDTGASSAYGPSPRMPALGESRRDTVTSSAYQTGPKRSAESEERRDTVPSAPEREQLSGKAYNTLSKKPDARRPREPKPKRIPAVALTPPAETRDRSPKKKKSHGTSLRKSSKKASFQPESTRNSFQPEPSSSEQLSNSAQNSFNQSSVNQSSFLSSFGQQSTPATSFNSAYSKPDIAVPEPGYEEDVSTDVDEDEWPFTPPPKPSCSKRVAKAPKVEVWSSSSPPVVSNVRLVSKSPCPRKMYRRDSAGFVPLHNRFLLDRLQTVVQEQVESVTDHLHIRVPESISLYCLADPTRTLEPGEISVQFSMGFKDQNLKHRWNCLEGDVLVARNPAHLPSDIQKVRAVCAPHRGLRSLTDVVVFSTKGDAPLAGLLSGGDYDGDKVWICWDPRLVDSFTNSPSTYSFWDHSRFFSVQPLPPTTLEPNIRSPDFWPQFFRRGFEIALQDSMLGMCTNLFENYAYARYWRMDQNMVFYAKLCGVFVDAQKQGLVPTSTTVAALRLASRRYNNKPAYRAPKQSQPPPGTTPESWFLLDRLVFQVAKNKSNKKMTRFTELRKNSQVGVDHDLTEPLHREEKRQPGAMRRLVIELRKVREIWKVQMAQDGVFADKLKLIHAAYAAIKPVGGTNKVLRMWETSMEEPHSYSRLVKASAAYYVDQTGDWPWWMAGPELCRIKADEVWWREKGTLPPRTITQDMAAIMKPNPKTAPERWRGAFEGEMEVDFQED